MVRYFAEISSDDGASTNSDNWLPVSVALWVVFIAISDVGKVQKQCALL